LIVDIHGHVNAPPELYHYQATLFCDRGAHGKGAPALSGAQAEEWADRTVAVMDAVATDIQLISPRPYAMLHAQRPPEIVHWWIEANNDFIAAQVACRPERLRGVAGLPQVHGTLPSTWLPELERAVQELGFVGCLLNPDPSEGSDYTPPLGDRFWYPLYEKLVELDVPALIHSAGCQNGRESYSAHFITEESIAILSLLNSTVLLDFPDLKLVVSHGGGSVPYQVGRWRAARLHPKIRHGQVLDEPFDVSLRRLFYDTCLYDPFCLELLFRIVGADRCMLGTEKPGSGSAPDPVTGRDMDELKPVIESLTWITADEKRAILGETAMEVYRLAR
jgi:predicted TIM-barrel fold metal-dependent hydrolase